MPYQGSIPVGSGQNLAAPMGGGKNELEQTGAYFGAELHSECATKMQRPGLPPDRPDFGDGAGDMFSEERGVRATGTTTRSSNIFVSGVRHEKGTSLREHRHRRRDRSAHRCRSGSAD
jgi:hypothetical protein